MNNIAKYINLNENIIWPKVTNQVFFSSLDQKQTLVSQIFSYLDLIQQLQFNGDKSKLFYQFTTMGSCCPELIVDELCLLGNEPAKISREAMKKHPHRLIGLITFENEAETGTFCMGRVENGPLCIGTGILLSQNLVLTVAHNIFSHKTKTYYKNHRFYQKLCGEANEYYTVQSFFIPKVFTEKNEPEFDYALLKLSNKVDSYNFISLNPNFMEPSANQKVGIYGYNKHKANWEELDHENKYNLKAFQCGLELPTVDRIKVPLDAHERFTHMVSTFAGTSGAPIILFEEDNKISIIGIHKGGDKNKQRNVGRRITSSLIAKLKDEAKKLGAQPFEFIEASKQEAEYDDLKSSLGFERMQTGCEF